MDNFTPKQQTLYNTIKAAAVLPRLADHVASRMYASALKDMSTSDVSQVLLQLLQDQRSEIIKYMDS